MAVRPFGGGMRTGWRGSAGRPEFAGRRIVVDLMRVVVGGGDGLAGTIPWCGRAFGVVS